MKNVLLIGSALLLVSFAVSSCDTATGQGAGWGAATGAILGAAATGNVRGAVVARLLAQTPALSSVRPSMKLWPCGTGHGREVVFRSAAERKRPGFIRARIRHTKSTACAESRMALSWKT